jgi:signal transduction histidine kinase
MTPLLSLRSRLLLGAALWTTGLFIVAGLVLTQIMFRNPRAPGVFHDWFLNVMPLSIAAIACLVAGLFQVRRGLASFSELRTRLSGVREGRDPRVDGVYPAEVEPLVTDLNALLSDREQRVTRALTTAGDLAHGLKTPLAVLNHEAQRAAAAGHDELARAIAQQVERMRRQVDYHLAHARASAAGANPGARCQVLTSADGLARTMLALHVDRKLRVDVDVPHEHVARVQREDLDEMLGNLVDNACKWAASRVLVTSRLQRGRLTISVGDDGPGLAPSLREAVLRRGVRADEAAPGSGLGLAIVSGLAELYRGSIELDQSVLGGVEARLELPTYVEPRDLPRTGPVG